jgi:DNA-binding CsgD family transcriptional regulator
MNSTEARIAEKIAEIARFADEIPAIVMIHRFKCKTTSIVYMSKRGLDYFNTTIYNLMLLGDRYIQLYMNQQDADDYRPRIFELLKSNSENEIFTFFQQLRPSTKTGWDWFISSIKILMRDDAGQPLLLIVSSVPIDPLKHVTRKVSRLLEESIFIRENQVSFDCLSAREQEILNLIANGKSNREIAESHFISINTVETHRKNIKAKLGARSNHELLRFARAFEA